MKQRTPLGPLMIDFEGYQLSSNDEEILKQPLVGGVILFSRNYQSAEQLSLLCSHIHSLKDEPLLIAVDHEGGRVQRFRQGFSEIPSMEKLGLLFEQDEAAALQAAKDIAWLLATELREVGVDFSFAPVLDLNYGCSQVIGDRAFSADKATVAKLACAFQEGLNAAGMGSIGKHFPGHGAVIPDSHVDLPIDDRPFKDIIDGDVAPFKAMSAAGMAGVMPAHIIYQQVDSHPAGFSAFWLKEVLRQTLGFDGVIFSDDLSMEGASIMGSFEQRARAALKAGCDMALVCNNRKAAVEVIEGLSKDFEMSQQSSARLSNMRANNGIQCDDSRSSERWKIAQETVQRLKTL